MSQITIGTIALVGLGFIVFSLFSIAAGRIRYNRGDGDFGYIERSRSPLNFWLTAIGFLSGGLVALAVGVFFYFRR
jgi:hypothetical protein